MKTATYKELAYNHSLYLEKYALSRFRETHSVELDRLHSEINILRLFSPRRIRMRIVLGTEYEFQRELYRLSVPFLEEHYLDGIDIKTNEYPWLFKFQKPVVKTEPIKIKIPEEYFYYGP